MSEPWDESELEQWEQRLKKDLTRENIERFFAGLPEETHPEYYPQIKTLFKIEETSRRQELLKEIFEDTRLHIETDRPTDDVRFACLYFLVSCYRRKDDIGDFARWLDRGEDEFGDRPLYRYQRAILHRERNEYPEAIDKCRPIIREYPESWPLAVGFAHNIVHGIERGLIRDARENDLAEEAVDTIETVLKAQPENGKSHLIKARALSIIGRYQEALDEVDRAIELEDSSQDDYAERIADYYFHRVRIEVAREKREMERKTAQVEERIDTIQSRFIQFIGFFAAILAVVFTSAEIAVSLSPDAAVRVVLVLTSGLIGSFASLSLLLPGNQDINRVIGVLGLGIAGLVVGIFLL